MLAGIRGCKGSFGQRRQALHDIERTATTWGALTGAAPLDLDIHKQFSFDAKGFCGTGHLCPETVLGFTPTPPDIVGAPHLIVGALHGFHGSPTNGIQVLTPRENRVGDFKRTQTSVWIRTRA